ncbi:NUDIX hydrolase [Patescibacteria group bacterium]|nr:NUDIX hydrolase [Patescibacteria group bacterium]MCL5091409.1 NUDIX hydrolase [Patescibacteria group bacterium]
MAKPQMRVGIGILILRGKDILLGRRISGHRSGTWQTAGGHLEFGESFNDCVRREIDEEVGIKVTNIRQVIATNDIFHQEHKHYVSVFMACDYVSGDPIAREPDKCSEWRWFPKDKLPSPLFLPYAKVLRLVK